MKIKIAIVVSLSALALLSCRKALITPDEVGNEPVRNFELFWNDVDKTYPFFTDDNLDWQAIYDKFRPMVNENTSTEKLFSIFSEMMKPLIDGHRSLTWGEYSWAAPLKYRPSDRYRFPVIKNLYLQNVSVLTQPSESDPSELDTVLITAKTKDNKYAYLGVRSYFTEEPMALKVAQFLNSAGNVEGIIVDLRNNGGGNVYQMFEFMALFAKYDVPYANYQPRIGPLKDNLFPIDLLSEPDFKIEAIGSPYANKKVVFITDRICFSAAEHSAMAAKQMGYPVVGDTTGGALSLVVEKTLPNGIQYVLVNSRITDINGKLWERIGVPPTIPIKATRQDFISDDPFMNRALIELGKM